jgi:DNA invertase Pin-like site-specific DNA recombinase
MILTVMAAVATLERDVINERTQGGRKAKAANGGYAYGSPRFGKVAVDGELVADSKEVEIIEVIRKHRKSGKSFASIASYLNDNCYPTKRGGKWQSETVRGIYQRLFPVAA